MTAGVVEGAIQPRLCGVVTHAEGDLLMMQLEGELADHLRRLGDLGADEGPAHPSAPLEPIASYSGAALTSWGFVVAQAHHGALGRGLVARLGYGPLGRVQLRACLQPQPGADPGIGGVAVLLTLSRLLAQHQLRYGLEVVVHGGPIDRASPAGSDGGSPLPEVGPALAALCFDGPGQLRAPNRLGAAGTSATLAMGARRLLARYPEVAWDERRRPSCIDGIGLEPLPGLWVGAGPSFTRAWPVYSAPRLREAAMLGAEIVALLQTHTPASCRPEGLAA